ncbi:2-oxoglutarate synthase subunit alpha [Helicobacter sp.]|uniref:2-oxoglutarate synthase subunit alpha n=1 Tax=Helicobacter sp. TaxID=218 RepID=UPI0025BB571C|nr:2-oxoglutarate synthase subunit alpha [Helicobacter sp.]MCI5968749.1 2-oxoglutarate synthase subunit alpha [Helicobacter sp.]MDY2584573.1 2-oxoglutarate synthase subunit alpha [Helicobacter sp.]
MSRELISSGNELVAHAAIDVGCRFFGGYPITPSSEVAHEMSVMLPQENGSFIQMEDEIGGISVALGASMSGVKAMTATSGPGISLKAEQIGLSFMAEIPLVIVNVMRGGPSTGLPTRVAQGDIAQAANPTHGDFQSIALCPGSLEEAYTETVRAFNLAEKFMTPVFLLLDETLGHMHGKAVVPELGEIQKSIINRREYTGDKNSYKPYGVAEDESAILNPFFKGYRYHITGLHHGPTGFPTEDAVLSQKLIDRLFNKILSKKSEIVTYEEYKLDDAEILLIAYGSTSRSAKEAVDRLREEGKKVGLFRPITLWPSPKEELVALGKRFDKILVAELNKGQYAKEVEHSMKKEIALLAKANGRPLSPLEIINKIKEL